MDLLSLLSNLQFLWFLLGVAFTAAAFLWFICKKQWRLFNNLKRPVAVIASADDTMDQEVELLNKVEFFNVHHLSDPQRGIDLIDGQYRLVVLRYHKGSTDFWKTFDSLVSKRMPVVIFSKPGEIDLPDIQKIQAYSLHTLCNTPLRLISDIFAIMSTYPEDKK